MMGRYVSMFLGVVTGFLEACCPSERGDYRFQWGPVTVDQSSLHLGVLERGHEYQDTLWVFNPGEDTLRLELAADGLLRIRAEHLLLLPHQEKPWFFRLQVPDSCRIGDAWDILGLTIGGMPVAGSSLPLEAMIVENLPWKEQAEGVAPVLEISDTLYQLGQMKREELQEVEIQLKNRGQGDLWIRQVESSCGCVQPEFSSQAISAGDTAVVKLRIRPEGIAGEITKRLVRIYCNAPECPVVSIRINYQIISN